MHQVLDIHLIHLKKQLKKTRFFYITTKQLLAMKKYTNRFLYF